jgi:hypothetical protein
MVKKKQNRSIFNLFSLFVFVPKGFNAPALGAVKKHGRCSKTSVFEQLPLKKACKPTIG